METQPALKINENSITRLRDKWGAGWFGAWRTKTDHEGVKHKYRHKGTDFCADGGTIIKCICDAVVTRIGYPYSPNDPKRGHLRYIEVTTPDDYRLRFMYVTPAYHGLSVGDRVFEDDEIGVAQGLEPVFPGIVEHIHFEVREQSGAIVNPMEYLKCMNR
jgi:murein DD-endopeptidase MepM/ murein hydrolase activator NlpD